MVASRKNKPLEPWQREDAKRLKKLFADDSELSQEKFGEKYKIGTQGAVWQYLNGRIALNVAAATRFAKGLKCDVADFSPTLAKELNHTPAEVDNQLSGDSLEKLNELMLYWPNLSDGVQNSLVNIAKAASDQVNTAVKAVFEARGAIVLQDDTAVKGAFYNDKAFGSRRKTDSKV